MNLFKKYYSTQLELKKIQNDMEYTFYAQAKEALQYKMFSNELMKRLIDSSNNTLEHDKEVLNSIMAEICSQIESTDVNSLTEEVDVFLDKILH